MDLFRSGRSVAPAGAVRPEPRLSASSSPVQSETQWKGFVVGAGGGPSRAGVRIDEKTVLSLPASMQAVRVLSGVLASAPIDYYNRVSDSERQRMTGHPLQRLVHDAPNGVDSAFQFKELAWSDLLLTGNFFAFVSEDAAGRPVALTRLKPGAVRIAEFWDRSEGHTYFYDVTLPDGTGGRFPARSVFHLRGMTRDGIYGLNPLQYMRDAFGNAVASGRHAARYFGKGARPQVTLEVAGKVTREDKEAIRRDWNAMHGGLDGEGTAVLDQGMKASALTFDNQKSQFIETRGFEIGELARIWGVPPHLIFDLSRATFSNIEHQSLEFVTYHLGPHFARMEQALTRAFAEPGHYFEHRTEALVRGDIKTETEAAWYERQMGVANANEIRARRNRNPIPGDAGTEYWRPANMTLAGAPAPTPRPAASVAAITEENI